MLHKLLVATTLLLPVFCNSPAAEAQIVTFNTNVGDIVVELFPDEAPISVANFLGYIDRGDYDGTFFHRSVPNFVVQGGGFLLPDGAQIPLQDPIENEFGRSNLRGTMAYARSGGEDDPESVNTATSQFFFNVSDNVGLDTFNEGFTVFGEVVSGMDVVDAINGFQRANFGGAPFNEVPVQAIQSDSSVLNEDFVILNGLTVVVLGDVNQDGMVSFLDISPFIALLSVGEFQAEADINQDGMVDFLDISLFIALLSS